MSTVPEEDAALEWITYVPEENCATGFGLPHVAYTIDWHEDRSGKAGQLLCWAGVHRFNESSYCHRCYWPKRRP